MKSDLSITNVERDYSVSERLVLELDLKGIITSANASFCVVSGYAESELVGSSLDKVRHPDMPDGVPEDMWRTVKVGAQWSDVVKNSCSNGDYFWVMTVVTPIKEGDRVIGYRSVRTKPTREEVANAERLYKRIKSGETTSLNTIETRRKSAGWLGRFPFSARYWLLSALYGACTTAVLISAMCGVGTGVLLSVFIVGSLICALMTGYVVAHDKKSFGLILSSMKRWKNGALLAKADYHGADELGLIATEFNAAADLAAVALSEVTQVAAALAKGDVSRRIKVTLPGEMAEMKSVFNHSIDNVGDVVEALGVLSNELVHGSFAWRNHTKVEGVLGENLKKLELAMRSIDAVMVDVGRVMIAVSNGDMRAEVMVKSEGELSTLKGRINTNFEQLSISIGGLAQTIQQVSVASHECSNAISQISEGAQSQMHAINQVANAVRETSASVADVTASTEEANRKSHESLMIVRSGKVKMERMVDAVNSIAANSEKINKFTEVIESIANKTNLLSLNAAIEAARAGEHGKGFAVVAEEVGKLAANSASSTQEIAILVKQAVEDANRALLTVKEVAKDMECIENGSNESNGMMERIAAALEEQNVALQGIGVNVTNLNRLGESNAAATEEISATMVDLSRIANDAKTSVSRYQLKKIHGEFPAMRQGHMNWVVTVHDIMAGKKNPAEVKLVSHRDCKLGQWLYSEGLNKYGNLPLMSTLEHEHMCMHDNVKVVVDSLKSGNREAAELAAHSVEIFSGKVVDYLFSIEKQV